MPYIPLSERTRAATVPLSEGELNYALTRLAVDYLDRRGKSYKAINEVIGALECAKLEFYSRVVVPYEHVKRVEHGDVY